jgi:hypothetical protein
MDSTECLCHFESVPEHRGNIDLSRHRIVGTADRTISTLAVVAVDLVVVVGAQTALRVRYVFELGLERPKCAQWIQCAVFLALRLVV